MTTLGRLFATSDPKRFFRLPDGLEPAAGPLRLRSLAGVVLDVDPDSVALYELSEAQAQRDVGDEIAHLAKNATRIIASFATAMRDAAPPDAHDGVPFTAEQFRTDPTAAMAGLKALFAGIVEMTKAGISDDPAARASAKDRMATLAGVIERDTGEKLPLADLPERLREMLTDPALLDRLKVTTGRVREATEAIRPSPTSDPLPWDGGEEPA